MRKNAVWHCWCSSVIGTDAVVWANQNKDAKTKNIYKVKTERCHWNQTAMVHEDEVDDDDDDHCETVAYFESEERLGKSVQYCICGFVNILNACVEKCERTQGSTSRN